MKKEERLRLLIVEDEENLRHMLAVTLSKQGYHADIAVNGAEALEMAKKNSYDFILCDIRMPVMDGAEFLRQALQQGISATVIMMSAYGTVDTAVECMKLGAYDYISKPFKNDEVLLVLKKAEERERLKAENRILREEMGLEYSFDGMVSRSPCMQEIFTLVRRVTNYRIPVLIQGESGTGKELVAKAVHFNGSRRSFPFVAVNCGAIPEHLLESELFGHRKGAFTDAVTDKAGLFEEADGGTLFLDEVVEMSLSLQVKLLRVLQEGEIRRIGADRTTKINVRIISATSRDLESEAAEGRFREDLLYRLNAFSIVLPPLRERSEDVPLLVEHFIDKHAQGRDIRPSPEALRLLSSHHWPGNVRELENCIERGLVLCDGRILDERSLPASLFPSASPGSFSIETLSIKKEGERLERDLIRRALEQTGGNRTWAARLLEISHRTLLYKLKEYDIE